jgi:hypothetical protein
MSSYEQRECTCLVQVALLALLAAVGCRAQVAPSEFPHLTAIVIPVGGDPEAVVVADVNHDGKPDIIAANPNSGTVTVLLGDGKGHFHPAAGSPFPAGHLPSDVGIGDFNGDGDLDLLLPNHQTPYVTLLLGDGKGGFRPAPHSPFATHSFPHPHGLAVGHFCGDDRPLDAAIDSWGSGQIELLIATAKEISSMVRCSPRDRAPICRCGRQTSTTTEPPTSLCPIPRSDTGIRAWFPCCSATGSADSEQRLARPFRAVQFPGVSPSAI